MAALTPLFTAVSSVSGTAWSAAAAGIGALSSLAAGQYQSRVALANAKIAEDNAKSIREIALLDAQRGDQDAQSTLGAIIAQASASGLDIGVGSTALRRRSAEVLAGRDRIQTVYEGQRQAAGYQQEANNYRAEAKAAKTSGLLGAFTSALSFDGGGSLIGSSTAVSPATARRIVRPRPNPSYGAI